MDTFYRKIFYSFNRQLTKIKELSKSYDIPLVSFVGFSPWNRCFNIFDILISPEELKEKINNIKEFLSKNHTELNNFCEIFSDTRFKESKAYLSKLKPPETEKIDPDELLYHLLILYHHFPRHPELMFDGVIKRMLPGIDSKQERWIYATMDQDSNPDSIFKYNYYPWVKVRLFNDKHEEIASYYQDQENNRGFDCLPDKVVDKIDFIEHYFEKNKLLFRYLDPLFLGYRDEEGNQFSGKSSYYTFKQGETFGKPSYFLAVPNYDEGLPARPFGRVIGNLFLVFSAKDKRKQFMKCWI